MDAPHDETNGTVARDRPRNLIYAVAERPPLPHLLALGLQYAVLVSIYLVLVVIVVRHAHVARETAVSVVSLAAVAAAVGTAPQALPRGTVGSGFLAPPVYSAIYLAPCVLAADMGGLPLVFGMTAFAGLVEIVLSFCFASMRVVLQPVLTGFTVFIVGMQLGVVGIGIGIGETLDVADEALAAYPLHLVVTTLTLSTCVALSIWGKGVARLFCTLAALVVGMIAAASIGLISPASLHTIATRPLLGMPDLGVISYDFNFGLAPAFLAGGLDAALRTIGVPHYFEDLSPTLRSIASSPLAIGLIAAIGLTLIFRIGTRQRVKLVWASQTDPIETASAFIKTTAAGWKVTASAVDRCVEDAERLLAYLRDLAPGGTRAEIGLAFDGIDLVFDLRAAGREPFDAGSRSQAAPAVQDGQ
jgi:NCS2 family nucleobase:cation symporter-2